MNRIGRNDLCPCGSGKKYKKCHLGKMDEETLLVTYGKAGEQKPLREEGINILNYDQAGMLLSLAALQLDPKNHGKNIRLEELVFEVLKNGERRNRPVTHKDLVHIFEEGYHFHALEDPVTSFFTENTIFFGGNYRVYPGITTEGTSIFNTFLEAIFTYKNTLPSAFKDKVEAGITWLLYLSEAMASTAGHLRYLSDGNGEHKIYVAGERELQNLKNAVYFTKEFIEKLAAHIKFPVAVLEEFIIREQLLPDNYDPDAFVLMERPILELKDGYIFLIPPAVVECGTAFIKRIASEERCEAALIDCFHEWQWRKVVEHAYTMGWRQTTIKLPPVEETLHVKEGVFRFDNEKLAYVCFVKNKPSFGEEYQEGQAEVVQDNRPRASLEERHQQVLAYLNELNGSTPFRYFTLFVLGGIGETSYFMWPKPKPGNQTLALSFADFEKIIFAGGLDQLSLWKFAKAYSKAAETTRFSPFSTILDSYVMYKENHGSLLPGEQAAPDYMYVVLGTSTEFEREALAKRDEHSAKRLISGRLADTPVIKHKEFAPIYKEREWALQNRLLIESFVFPLWIVNAQPKNQLEKSASNDFIEAIAFWMFRLAPLVEKNLNDLGRAPIEINVTLDSQFLRPGEAFEWKEKKREEVPLSVSVNERAIHIHLPFELAHLLILEHNEAERHIMTSVLSGFNLLLPQVPGARLSTSFIDDAIDKVLPLGPAKMILFIDSSRDPRLDTRGLLSTRYIEDAETSFILDNLVELIKPEKPIPSLIDTPGDKNALCTRIVATLIKQIEGKLADYDAREVLEWLMRFNERYVHNREFREFQIPAKIACFSDFPTEVEEFLEKESKLVNSALSVRCLIEFVAANPKFGNRRMNLDELDELMALMNEVCNWGIIADAIHLGMDDPRMGLLPSGRIGMSHDFYENYLKPFGEARAESVVYGYTTSFESKMRIAAEEKPAAYTPEAREIDDAFTSEWKISATKLMNLKKILIELGMSFNKSVVHMEESTLKEVIKQKNEDFSDEEVTAGLKLLSLEKRASLGKPPHGFEKDDVYPWKYNRNLSYIRRPLIKLMHPDDGKIHYYWGFRHLMAAGENLRSLVMTGRIKAKEGGVLSTLVAKINAQKGDDYRKSVYQWLEKNTELELIPYEVTINVNGHLKADKDYGDIDILAIDKGRKIVYSIECKNTVSARVIHEMKTELDKYLGREGNPGMIHKHVERDTWLQNHKTSLEKFIEHPELYQIQSFVLSSEEIPTMYLAKERLPLPIVAFSVLKRKGWNQIIY